MKEKLESLIFTGQWNLNRIRVFEPEIYQKAVDEKKIILFRNEGDKMVDSGGYIAVNMNMVDNFKFVYTSPDGRVFNGD